MACKIFVFVCVILSVALGDEIESQCPKEENTIAVDMNRFSGNWTVIGGVPPQKNFGKCLQFNIRGNESEKFTIDFVGISSITNKTAQWKVEGVHQGGRSLNGSWTLRSPKIVFEFLEHRIVALDEENYQYAVMFLCGKGRDSSKKNYIHAVIMSRGPILNSEKFVNGVPLRQYLDSSITKFLKAEIKDVDNSAETCAEYGLL